MGKISNKEIIRKLSSVKIKSSEKWQKYTLTKILNLKDKPRNSRYIFTLFIFYLKSLKDSLNNRAFLFYSLIITLVFSVLFSSHAINTANNSLPGDPLFAVDKAWEDVKRQFEREEFSRTSLEIDNLDERIEEYSLLENIPSNQDKVLLAIEEIEKQESRVEEQIKIIKNKDTVEEDIVQKKNKLIDKYKKLKKKLEEIEIKKNRNSSKEKSIKDNKLMNIGMKDTSIKPTIRRRPQDQDRDGSTGDNGSNDGEGDKPREGWEK